MSYIDSDCVACPSCFCLFMAFLVKSWLDLDLCLQQCDLLIQMFVQLYLWRVYNHTAKGFFLRNAIFSDLFMAGFDR